MTHYRWQIVATFKRQYEQEFSEKFLRFSVLWLLQTLQLPKAVLGLRNDAKKVTLVNEITTLELGHLQMVFQYTASFQTRVGYCAGKLTILMAFARNFYSITF